MILGTTSVAITGAARLWLVPQPSRMGEAYDAAHLSPSIVGNPMQNGRVIRPEVAAQLPIKQGH